MDDMPNVNVEHRRRALFVGVQNYQDVAISKLHYAINDTNTLEEIFKELGFETKCLSDTSQPALLEAISNSTKDLGQGDMFLFFFSGHGFSIGGEDLVFCPEHRKCDLNAGPNAGLSYSLIKSRTNASNKKLGQFDRIFLFDTCRSYLGGIRGGGGNGFVKLSDGERINTKDLRPMTEFTRDMSGSIFVLRSCRSGEESLEVPNRKEGNGLFTLAIERTLKGYIDSRRPIMLDSSFYESVLSEITSVKSEKGYEGWEQTPEWHQTGRTIRIGGEEWTMLDYSGKYDGMEHGISLCGKLPDGAKISYRLDLNEEWGTRSPQFVDVGIYTVYFKVQVPGQDNVEGERKVTIKARPLVMSMLRSRCLDKQKGDKYRPVLRFADAAPCCLTDDDWQIVATECNANMLDVTVEGRRNYYGQISLSIPIPGDPVPSKKLKDMLDKCRTLLTESADMHSKCKPAHSDLAVKFRNWQDRMYDISGGGQWPVDISVCELEKLFATIEKERTAFWRQFDRMSFFIEHQRMRVTLMSKKLLPNPVAEVVYKCLKTQKEY